MSAKFVLKLIDEGNGFIEEFETPVRSPPLFPVSSLKVAARSMLANYNREVIGPSKRREAAIQMAYETWDGT